MTWQDTLAKLQAVYPTLPPAKQQVASFIFDSYDQIPLLTVTDLAQRIGVSDTTIINLCADLGFKGFAEFKRLLREYVQSQGTMINYFTRTAISSQSQNPEEAFLTQQLQNMHKTLSDPVNLQCLPKAVALLTSAPRVCIVGFRASGNIAQAMAYQLRQLSIPTEVITPGLGDYMDRFLVLSPDTLVVAFSFPRYTQSLLQSVEFLKQRGHTIIGFTDTGNSPLRKLVDICFSCRNTSKSFTGSYSACLGLVELISARCAIGRQDLTLSHLRQLENSFDSFQTFYNEGK